LKNENPQLRSDIRAIHAMLYEPSGVAPVTE
jgi:hypothetical protein